MFINNLKKYRLANNLTQKQLAALVGKKFLTIHRYENNDIQIPAKMLKKFSEILGVPENILFVKNDIDFYTEIHDIFNNFGCNYQRTPDGSNIFVTKTLMHSSLLCQFNFHDMQSLISSELEVYQEHIKFDPSFARPFIECVIINILIKYIDNLLIKDPSVYNEFTNNAICLENKQDKELLLQWKADLKAVKQRDTQIKNDIISFVKAIRQKISDNVKENLKLFCKGR